MSHPRNVVHAAARRTSRSFAVLVAALSVLAATAIAYADGIDVSHWQGNVNWSKVRSDGVTFAFMKATEGTNYTDPSLKANWAGTKNNGIYRGAYHFARPSTGSAAAQARYFVSKVGTFKEKGDLPPVLDLEVTGGLGPAALRSWVRTWLETTEQLTGRTPILYFSPYFWIDHMGNATNFTHWPLWIAHYTTGRPLVPGGWKTWTFWQRTSSGSVSGIGGNVDMNRFNGTSAQLAKLAYTSGGSTTPPPPGPTVPAATTLTMSPSDVTPAWDDTVTFSGDLKSAAPAVGLPTRPVSLWARPVGATRWSKIAGTNTDSAGHYVMTAGVPRTADYQTRWAGGPSYAPSASPTVRLTSPPRTATAVDLKADKTSVSKGEAVVLYGHVTQALHPSTGVAGLEVDYYKRSTDGPWIFVGKSTSVAPTGWHSITIHPLISREWKAVVVGNASYEPRTSNHLVVSPH